MRLSCPNRWSFGLFARLAPLGVDQVLRQVVDERGRSHVAQVYEVEIDLLADDSRVLRD